MEVEGILFEWPLLSTTKFRITEFEVPCQLNCNIHQNYMSLFSPGITWQQTKVLWLHQKPF